MTLHLSEIVQADYQQIESSIQKSLEYFQYENAFLLAKQLILYNKSLSCTYTIAKMFFQTGKKLECYQILEPRISSFVIDAKSFDPQSQHFDSPSGQLELKCLYLFATTCFELCLINRSIQTCSHHFQYHQKIITIRKQLDLARHAGDVVQWYQAWLSYNQILQESIRVAPEPLWHLLGLICSRCGRHTDAVEFFWTSIDVDPYNLASIKHLGFLSTRSKNFVELRQILKQKDCELLQMYVKSAKNAQSLIPTGEMLKEIFHNTRCEIQITLADSNNSHSEDSQVSNIEEDNHSNNSKTYPQSYGQLSSLQNGSLLLPQYPNSYIYSWDSKYQQETQHKNQTRFLKYLLSVSISPSSAPTVYTIFLPDHLNTPIQPYPTRKKTNNLLAGQSAFLCQGLARQLIFSFLSRQISQIDLLIYSLNQPDKALELLNSILSVFVTPPPRLSLLTKAICLYHLGRYVQSKSLFKQYYQIFPLTLEGIDVYSTVLWHTQDQQTLSHLAHLCIKQNRFASETWIVVGNCFSLFKQHEKAIKFFKRAQNLLFGLGASQPGFGEFSHHFVDMSIPFRDQVFSETAESFTPSSMKDFGIYKRDFISDQAKSLSNHLLKSNHILVKTLEQQGILQNYPLPKSYKSMANTLNFQSVDSQRIYIETLQLLGHEYIACEMYPSALLAFRRSLFHEYNHLVSTNYKSWYGIATVHFAKEEFELALSAFQKALDMCCRNSSIAATLACYLGTCHVELGNLGQAQQCFRDALILDPLHKLTQFRLGQVLVKCNRYKDALVVLLRLLAQESSDPTIYIEIANIYILLMYLVTPDESVHTEKKSVSPQNLRSEALKYFNAALDLEPDRKDVRHAIRSLSQKSTALLPPLLQQQQQQQLQKSIRNNNNHFTFEQLHHTAQNSPISIDTPSSVALFPPSAHILSTSIHSILSTPDPSSSSTQNSRRFYPIISQGRNPNQTVSFVDSQDTTLQFSTTPVANASWSHMYTSFPSVEVGAGPGNVPRTPIPKRPPSPISSVPQQSITLDGSFTSPIVDTLNGPSTPELAIPLTHQKKLFVRPPKKHRGMSAISRSLLEIDDDDDDDHDDVTMDEMSFLESSPFD